jgi:hypothetical protein
LHRYHRGRWELHMGNVTGAPAMIACASCQAGTSRCRVLCYGAAGIRKPRIWLWCRLLLVELLLLLLDVLLVELLLLLLLLDVLLLKLRLLELWYWLLLELRLQLKLRLLELRLLLM